MSIYGTNIAENRGLRARLVASNAINGRQLETEEQFTNHSFSVDRRNYRDHTYRIEYKSVLDAFGRNKSRK